MLLFHRKALTKGEEVLAAAAYSNCCFGGFDNHYADGTKKPEDKQLWMEIAIRALGFDIIASITLSVVGILGVTGIVALSPAASYGMIIGAGVIMVSAIPAISKFDAQLFT
ncbi:MAG: hypothetical protein K940chlam9_00323 [Chlamydiae bacterium]|nr:hypothetical protein [Chlamydiota bacterium]